MAEDQESFGRLVVNRAASLTVKFFETKLYDAGYLVMSLVIGCALYYLKWGLPRAMSEALPIVMFSFAPLGIFVACVFIWNLWLAPSTLAYEANRAVIAHAAAAAALAVVPDPGKSIDWRIWKQRSRYTVAELAAILARYDPAISRFTPEVAAYQRLILEEIREHKLQYIHESRTDALTGSVCPMPIDHRTPVLRDNALNWARTKKFEVSHVQ